MKSRPEKLIEMYIDGALKPGGASFLRDSLPANEWLDIQKRKIKMDDQKEAVMSQRSTGLSALPGGGSDADKAKDYRERVLTELAKVIDILNEARQKDGFAISFQISGPDGFNRQSLALLEVSKKLC